MSVLSTRLASPYSVKRNANWHGTHSLALLMVEAQRSVAAFFLFPLAIAPLPLSLLSLPLLSSTPSFSPRVSPPLHHLSAALRASFYSTNGFGLVHRLSSLSQPRV